ncbi:MAG TPA: hypothetical protein PLZ95_04975 [Bryobacteraceae bacterium]|nr:hypothetical protein [Bryobacteraceae bacterium]
MKASHNRVVGLLRLFLLRSFDTDLVSRGGEAHRLAVTAISVLAAASLTLAVVFVIRYLNLSERPEIAALMPLIEWRDKEFLIALSMMATALALGLTAHTMFPDRRDAAILGVQPVPASALFWARTAAVCVAPACLAVAINSFTGLVFPAITAGSDAGLREVSRRVSIHIGVCLLAAGFVIGLTLTAQGLLSSLLPQRVRRTAAPMVQLGILTWMILCFTSGTGPSGGGRQEMVPTKWFLALYQRWVGGEPMMASWLSDLAVGSLATLTVGGLGLYSIGYWKAWRQAGEEAGERCSGPGWATRSTREFLRVTLLRKPEEEAAFYFAWRALTRNQKCQFVLALYLSLGTGIVAVGWERLAIEGQRAGPSALAVSLPLEFTALLAIGLRAVMPLPVELPANWVFRLHASGSPELYGRAVRLLAVMIIVVAAVLVPLPMFAKAWGEETALQMAALHSLVIAVLVRALYGRYHQIPFTCPYVPDKANLRIRLGWYVLAYLFAVALVSRAVASVLQGATSWATLASLLVISYQVSAWRAKRHGSTMETVIFHEDAPPTLTMLEIEQR